jgi:hypothetical protein
LPARTEIGSRADDRATKLLPFDDTTISLDSKKEKVLLGERGVA